MDPIVIKSAAELIDIQKMVGCFFIAITIAGFIVWVVVKEHKEKSRERITGL